jgi:hypothetical protein
MQLFWDTTEDPQTQKSDVLIRAEVYDHLRSPFDDADFDIKETYPLIWPGGCPGCREPVR